MGFLSDLDLELEGEDGWRRWVDLDDAEWTDDPHPEGRLSGYRWIQVAAAIPPDQIDHVLPLTTARIRAVVARSADAAEAA